MFEPPTLPWSDGVCPKRSWVMLTLADDDHGDPTRDREVPPLVSLHLAYCQTCREMAERILETNAALSDLAQESPTRDQVARILNQGLLAARDARPSDDEPGDEPRWAVRTGLASRVLHRLTRPRIRRFGLARRQVPLRHAVAAGLMFALVGGGYVAYRGLNLSPPVSPRLPSADALTPWTLVPTLREGVGEQLSVWQNQARSPFEKIQGWKGPIRDFDGERFTFGYTVAQPSPATESEPNATAENAPSPAGFVRIQAEEKHPAADSILNTVNGVDNPGSAVLSKGFKD